MALSIEPPGYRRTGERGEVATLALPPRFQVIHIFGASFFVFASMAVAFDRLGFRGSMQNKLLVMVVAMGYLAYRFQPRRVLTIADETMTYMRGKRIEWQGPIADVQCTEGGARGQGKASSFFYRTIRLVMGTCTIHITLIAQASRNASGPTFPLGELFGADEQPHVDRFVSLLASKPSSRER